VSTVYENNSKEVFILNLTPYNPFNSLESFRREIDHFFQNGMGAFLSQSESGIGFQKLDIHETEKEVVALCSLPGIEKQEDIHIDVCNNVLTVSGVIQKSNEVKDDQFHRRERYFGRFERSIQLQTQVNNDDINATYKNGVLEIRLPKQTIETKKKINVNFK
jgi:HSP20 family protein